MTPEFRLLPWERGGHPVAPAFEMSARVEGRERRFWVKTHEGRVYFRLADEEDARVWTLLESDPEVELEMVFRYGVETKQVARFFVVERSFSTQTVGEEFGDELKARFHSTNLHLFGPTTVAVAVCDDGRAFAQEWCGGPWGAFALLPRFSHSEAWPPSIWSRAWNVAGLRRAMASLAGQFAFRPFTPPGEVAGPMRFASGSQHELERLFHAAYVHFVPIVVVKDDTRTTGRFSRPAPTNSLKFNLTIQAETQQNGVLYSDYMRIIPSRLMDLLVAHNVPIGGSWRSQQWGPFAEDEGELLKNKRFSVEFNKRVDFHFSPHTLRLEAEIARESSAHERMEALLTLREWLEEKGYGAQVRQLLMV
ncbi:hypothetical protein IAD21_02403 [Abditibacteriota bacterium]|nr:hypothetical protein IAD21_02403 [Abditibacteriota bacterium]